MYQNDVRGGGTATSTTCSSHSYHKKRETCIISSSFLSHLYASLVQRYHFTDVALLHQGLRNIINEINLQYHKNIIIRRFGDLITSISFQLRT